MATAVRHDLLGCDGFRVEAGRGLVGWVEEAWLGASNEPSALAVRTVEGRRGLLLAEEVEFVARERELVHMAGDGQLLELDAPHFESASGDGRQIITASWHTTGLTLDPPPPPGPTQRALLRVRPWRLAAPPQPMSERPFWQTVIVLYACLAMIVGLVIGLSFLAARIFAGNPY